MENIGLKKYAKNLEKSLPLGKAFINLCPEQSNTIFSIPLLEKLGLNYYFNYQAKNTNGTMGKGGHISLFRQIKNNRVINADFSVDNYDIGAENFETGLTLNRVEALGFNQDPTYELKDRDGKTIRYVNPHFDFPSETTTDKGEKSTTKFEDNLITIKTNDNVLKLHLLSNGFVQQVTYKEYGLENEDVVNLTYDQAGFLTRIDCVPARGRAYSVAIIHGDNCISVIDPTNNCGTKFYFNNDRACSIKKLYFDALEDENEIAYDLVKCVTTVTDKTGSSEHYFFEKRIVKQYYFNSLTVNDHGCVKTKEYNDNLLPAYENGYDQIMISNAPSCFLAPSDMGAEISEYAATPFENTFLENTAEIIENGEAHINVSVNANGSDSFTLTCLVKAVDEQVEVTAKIDDEWTTIKVANNWKLLCVHKNITNACETIALSIVSTGRVVVGAIHLFKNAFANFYEYDGDGNTTNDGTNSFKYKAGKLSSIAAGNGVKYDLEYDPKTNDLIRFKGANGIVVENTYTNHEITRQVIKGRNGKEIHKETTVGDNNVEFYESNEPPCTRTRRDEYGSVIQEIRGLYPISDMEYNQYGEMVNLYSHRYMDGNSEARVRYEFDSKGNITLIAVDNGQNGSDGTIYEFEYDDLSRIISVDLNNETLFEYEYDSNNRVVVQRCGHSGHTYNVSYNDDSQISEVVCSQTGTRYTYTYDNFGRLDAINRTRNNATKLLEQYSYDDEGKITQVTNDTKLIDKVLDNNGAPIRTRESYNDKIVVQEYNSLDRSLSTNPENIVSEFNQKDGYSVAAFISSNDCIGGERTYECQYRNTSNIGLGLMKYEAEPFNEQGIRCLRAESSKNEKWCYLVNGDYGESDGQTVAFWFMPFVPANNCYLMFAHHKSRKSAFGIVEKDGCLAINLVDKNGFEETVLVSEKSLYSSEEWAFASVTFYQEYDEEKHPTNLICKLRVNSKKYTVAVNNSGSKYDFLGKYTEIDFGHRYEEFNSIAINCFPDAMFTLIAIGNLKKMDDDLLDSYYRKTKDYIADNSIDNGGMADACDHSSTTLIKTPTSAFGSFKVFPLNNNLFSLDYDSILRLNDDKPKLFDLRKGFRGDKDGVFNFNKTSKRYAFVADGNRLLYETNFNRSGTIAAKFMINETYDKQYLFDVKIGDLKVSLFRDLTTQNLTLMFNDNPNQQHTINRTTMYIGSFYNVALSFDKQVESDSGSYCEYTAFRVVFDNRIVETFNLTNVTVSGKAQIMLGRQLDSDEYPLRGQIIDFMYGPSYCDLESIKSISEQIAGIKKYTAYDEFGLPRREEIFANHASSSIVTKNIDYIDSNPTMVHHEKIRTKNSVTIADNTYEYDTLGNVTEIQGSNGHRTTYSYDFRGFMFQESYDGAYVQYTYDNNGNILTRGNDTFTYSTSSPDKLIRFNDQPVNYDSNNPGNISSFGNKTFEYDGRRLLKATVMLQQSRLMKRFGVVEFTYNEKGLRTSKTTTYYNQYADTSHMKLTWLEPEMTNRDVINYEYDGNRLTYEKSQTKEVFYLYDENKELYGYILNGVKYFYAKDFLNRIVGVVKEDGTVVATYRYDAFGNLKESTGNIYNPFMFKCYYYDSELEMYYCKSRFYIPIICRWLNADNATFLKKDDASKLNLFVYCSNNPVMLQDPDGHFSWGKFWKTVAIVVAAAAVVAATAALTAVTFGGAGVAAVCIGAGIAAGFSAASSIGSQLATTGKVDIAKVVIDASFGAMSGAIACSSMGPVGIVAGSGLIGFTNSVMDEVVIEGKDYKDVDWQQAAIDGIYSAGMAGVSYGVFGPASYKTLGVRETGKLVGKAVIKPVAKGIMEWVWDIVNCFADFLRSAA